MLKLFLRAIFLMPIGMLLCFAQPNQCNSANSQIEQIKNYSGRSLNSLPNQSPYAVISQVGDYNESIVRQQDADILKNVAILSQYGNFNSAEVNQVATAGDKDNISIIYQYENNNSASVSQAGYGNLLQLEQVNSFNKFIMDVEGGLNESMVLQEGGGNFVEQLIRGDNKKYEVIQLGDQHELYQLETDMRTNEYKVIQRGNGMKVMIINGSLR